jgi:hypothetical protein
MVTAFEVAGLPETQVALDVMRHVTTSPLENPPELYDGLLLPTLLPFTFHRYIGEAPPLTGVAVNVTTVPEHTGLEDAVMVILAARTGLTVMVIGLDVAGLPVAQVAFEVN